MIRVLALESMGYPLPSLPKAHITTLQFVTDEKVEAQELILKLKSVVADHLPPPEDTNQLELSDGYDDVAAVTAKGSC